MTAPNSADPAQALSTSLDYIRTPEGEPQPWVLDDPYGGAGSKPGRCERVNFDLLNLDTGQRVSGRCDVYRCPYCGPRKAWRYQQAAAWVGPERYVGLSLLPDTFGHARKQLNDLATRLRQRGYEWEWFWAIEGNPEGTGYHLGAVQKGSYVPQGQLQDMCGGRIPYIEAVRPGEGRRAVGYVAKGATGYVTKGALHGLEGYYEHLRLNGGAAAHWSRGYFGKPVDEVVRAMLIERHGEPEGTWVKVPRDQGATQNGGVSLP